MVSEKRSAGESGEWRDRHGETVINITVGCCITSVTLAQGLLHARMSNHSATSYTPRLIQNLAYLYYRKQSVRTRSTQRAQTSAERQQSSESGFRTSDSWIRAVIRIVTQNLITWSLGHALPLQEISSKSVHNFFSYPTDRQTDRQTNRLT